MICIAYFAEHINILDIFILTINIYLQQCTLYSYVIYYRNKKKFKFKKGVQITTKIKETSTIAS